MKHLKKYISMMAVYIAKYKITIARTSDRSSMIYPQLMIWMFQVIS